MAVKFLAKFVIASLRHASSTEKETLLIIYQGGEKNNKRVG
jgi:hypothetical protein